MKNLFNRFVREEQGQDLIEYALLAGLISLASVVAITALGTAIQGKFTQSARPSPPPDRSSRSKGQAMKNLFNRFVREEQGQDLIEYALLAGLISLASVAAITALGTAIQGHFTAAGAAVTARVPSQESLGGACLPGDFVPDVQMFNRRTGAVAPVLNSETERFPSDSNASADSS